MIVLGYVYSHATIRTVLPIVASSVVIQGETCSEMGAPFQQLMDRVEASRSSPRKLLFTMIVAEGFVGAGEQLTFEWDDELLEHEFTHQETGVVLTVCGECAWGIAAAKSKSDKGTVNIKITEAQLKTMKACVDDLVIKGHWSETTLTFCGDCCR